MIISTSWELAQELRRLNDDFITVKVDGKEYVIERICHEKTHTDGYLTHLCLICRDGGDGEVKR